MDLGLQFRKSRPAETTRCHCSLAAVQGHSREVAPSSLMAAAGSVDWLACLHIYIYSLLGLQLHGNAFFSLFR